MLRDELRRMHNMDLRTYLDGLPRGGVSAFAKRLNRSAVYLSQLAAKQDDRVASAELAVLIERESELAVRRWDLRPNDWWLIWPELIGAEGAPAVPAEVLGEAGEVGHG